MKEAVFNTEISRSINSQGGWYYKVADSPTSWTMKQTRYTPVKPCDGFGMYQGIGFLVECKQIKKWQSLSLKAFRQNQIESLSRFYELGGKSFVFLNIRISANKSLGQKRENRCLIFEWEKLYRWLSDRNLSKHVLNRWEYVQGKKGQFDMSKFFQNLHK